MANHGRENGNVAPEEPKMPAGFRFVPTDDEIVHAYLIPKVAGQPLQVSAISDMDSTQIYSEPPNQLVKNHGERKRLCFFTHGDGGSMAPRIVGNGIGFWGFNTEMSINNSDGQTLAFKRQWIYHTGSPHGWRRTNWAMFEYSLEAVKEEKEWIVGKIEYNPQQPI